MIKEWTIRRSLSHYWAPQVVLVVNNPPTKQETWVQDMGLGSSPGVGHGNPLQYSCLGNPMDGEAWRATVHSQQRVRQDEVLVHVCAHACTPTHTHTSLLFNPTSWYVLFVLVPPVLITCLLNTVVVLQYLHRIDQFQNPPPQYQNLSMLKNLI